MELYDYLLLPSQQKVKAIEDTLEMIAQNLKWYETQRKRDTENYLKLQEKFTELEKENEKLKTKLAALQNKHSKGEK